MVALDEKLEEKLSAAYTSEELQELGNVKFKDSKIKTLTLGAGGQIAGYLNDVLTYMYGKDNCTRLDVRANPHQGIIEVNALMKDKERLFDDKGERSNENSGKISLKQIMKYVFSGDKVMVFNLAAALSKAAQDNPKLSDALNKDFPQKLLTKLERGLWNILRVVTPSSIGAFRNGIDKIDCNTVPVPDDGKNENKYGRQKKAVMEATAKVNAVVKNFLGAARRKCAFSPVLPGIYTANMKPAAGTTEEFDRVTSFLVACHVAKTYDLELNAVLRETNLDKGNDPEKEIKHNFEGHYDLETGVYNPKVPKDEKVVMMSAESLVMNLVRLVHAQKSKVIDKAHAYTFGDFSASAGEIIDIIGKNYNVDVSKIKFDEGKFDPLMVENLKAWPKEADTTQAEKDFGYKKRGNLEEVVLQKFDKLFKEYEQSLVKKGVLKDSDLKQPEVSLAKAGIGAEQASTAATVQIA